MIFKPHQYQRNAIEFLLGQSNGGIFADPGLGKTAIILSIIDIFKKLRGPLDWFIVAPLRVCYTVWPDEIKKWDFDLTVNNLHCEPFKPADLHLVNPEGMKRLFWAIQRAPQSRLFGLVIDESTKFKNARSKRFRLLKTILQKFQKRIILTGTPTPKSLLDLFGQVYILDLGESLGRYITHYKNNYFYRAGYMGYQWEPFPQSADIIQSKIKPMIHRIDSKHYLDLPPLIVNDIWIRLPKTIREIYSGLEKELFTILETGESITIGSAASAYNACRQVANGGLFEQIDPVFSGTFYHNAAKRSHYPIHNEKTAAAIDLVDELHGKPVLIAYHYRHDLVRLKKAFPNAPFIGSGVSAKRSKEIIDQWNRGEIPVLIGHPKSMGHGLNLQAAGNDIIWYSLTDNLEDYLQFNQRIYRQGVKGQVRIHRIVARNTIDVALIEMLNRKEQNQTALLNALNRYRKNG